MVSIFVLAMAAGSSLVANPGFEAGDSTGRAPAGYALTGGAKWFITGYDDEIATAGVAFNTAEAPEGSVSQTVSAIDHSRGKWIRFTFRGLAEDGFKVPEKGLWMKMDFFAGSSSRDSAQRLITREIETGRRDFTANGNDGRGGAEVWRTYEFEELLPFPDVDSVRLTVGYKDGTGTAVKGSYFFIDDFALEQSGQSALGKEEPQANPVETADSTQGMVPLGGRWYYRPALGEQAARTTVITSANADRLFYKSDRLTNPFAGNMSAWMRKGYKDASGQIVSEDRFIEDSVTITFDGTGSARVFSRNLPNHPTAKFPDTYGTQGYNPSYIQEQTSTYNLPLDPQPRANAPFLSATNNQALPMGPIGVAVNGVVFFNPYDADYMDASSIMDRCCGHPNPGQNQYHYHKYPICVNTNFVDKGETHSPIIGFAFDGYPVYGPYESKGVMAKDLKENKLNAFNIHSDPERGAHYHVTPGRFPYLLGGYYGTPATGNTFRPRPPQ